MCIIKVTQCVCLLLRGTFFKQLEFVNKANTMQGGKVENPRERITKFEKC